jgi:hypothetical protein
MLNWQKNTSAAPQLMDTVYYNVWQITGPENVPGYGVYDYSVQLSSKVSANPNNFSASGGTTSWFVPLSTSTVQVDWSGGPTVGNVDYSPIVGFVGQWNVNVVEVAITAPPSGQAFNPGEPNRYVGQNNANSPLIAGVEASGAYQSIGGKIYENGIWFNAQVTLTGIGDQSNWGVSQIQFGFIQNGVGFQNDGTYVDGTSLKSSLDGNITPKAPVVDYVNGDPNLPWYDGNIYSQSSTDTKATNIVANGATISTSDGPGDGPPIYSDQSSTWEISNAHAINSVNLDYNFVMYLCAQTLDASTVYMAEAEASWTFSGTGTISDVNSTQQTFTWTGAAGSGVIPPTGWSGAKAGIQPVTYGPSFNSLLGGETFAARLAIPTGVVDNNGMVANISGGAMPSDVSTIHRNDPVLPTTSVVNATAHLQPFMMNSTHGPMAPVELSVGNGVLWTATMLGGSSQGTSPAHPPLTILPKEGSTLFLPLLIRSI